MTEVPSEAEELVGNGSRDTGRGLPWKSRTHCEHGHEFTAENTYMRSHGARRCRACLRAAGARWYATRGKALRQARRQAT